MVTKLDTKLDKALLLVAVFFSFFWGGGGRSKVMVYVEGRMLHSCVTVSSKFTLITTVSLLLYLLR